MRYLILINSMVYLLMNIFIPYQLIKMQELTNSLPLLLGIGLLTGAICSWGLGRIVDKNRKYSFMAGVFILACVVMAYTWVTTLWEFIILEICFVIGSRTNGICEKVIIADLAKNEALGAKFGFYDSIMAGVSGVALILITLTSINTQYLFILLGCLLLIPNILIYKLIK